MGYSLVHGLLELLLIEELQDEEDELPAERRHPPPTTRGRRQMRLGSNKPTLRGRTTPHLRKRFGFGLSARTRGGIPGGKQIKERRDRSRQSVRAYRRSAVRTDLLRSAPGRPGRGVESSRRRGRVGRRRRRSGGRFGGAAGFSIARGPRERAGRMRLSKGQYRQSTKGWSRNGVSYLNPTRR
jgi:hypothetical protein